MEWSALLKWINKYYPELDNCVWDWPGLQTLTLPKTEIKKILVSLDTTPEVVDYAITHNYDVIINHHPFIFGKYLDVIANQPTKKKMLDKLAQKNIMVYALHTNFDRSNWSINRWLLNELNCNNFNNFGAEQTATIGDLNSSALLEQIIMRLKRIFQLDFVQYYGRLSEELHNVMIASGAGGDILTSLKPDQVGVMITGELKWDQWLYAKTLKQNVIVVGHFMENAFVNIISEQIHEAFDDLKVTAFNIINPIKMI